ncbi:hypothetical protein SYJ56_04545 [Algoriphagus sp. D3-2-R+10]|uniref:hypothetical protein n=1 Tax=Algoriphagus aurantiacus TaxID=3103948 RepID=UPI002B38ED24|nr:hypothetical protein [Algoriphagus sp. D3-2-R+10]MEB2774561.1 hypothetical protein [Algoriphagus sp. D3-2-R+10]
MSKKLNDPSKGNKNLGTKQIGLGMLINANPETPQKEKNIQQGIRNRGCENLLFSYSNSYVRQTQI